MDKSDSIKIRFNGKNFNRWAFHLQHFVARQGLLEYLDGFVLEGEKNKSPCEQTTLKLVTWILNSIDPSIVVSLQSFSTTSEMWSNLQSIYHQVNKARRFFLDSKLAKYSQGDEIVQEYYSGFLTLWTEDSMILSTTTKEYQLQVLIVQDSLI